MSKKREEHVPRSAIVIGMLTSLPGCIPIYGIFLLMFTWPLVLAGILLVAVSKADAQAKRWAICLLVFTPLACQAVFLLLAFFNALQ